MNGSDSNGQGEGAPLDLFVVGGGINAARGSPATRWGGRSRSGSAK